MRTSAIGTEDTHGRSTPRDQPFSHGLDPKPSSNHADKLTAQVVTQGLFV
jgi:hypothetical protein